MSISHMDSDFLGPVPGRLIVFVQEQEQASLVHHVTLGERERPPHQTRQPLAQHVRKALHMRLY